MKGAQRWDRDRRSAQACLQPKREIRAELFDSYWSQWDTRELEEDPSSAPDFLIDEFKWLSTGEAVLRLQDGSRWIAMSAFFGGRDDGCQAKPGGNLWRSYLLDLFFEHAVADDEGNHGGKASLSDLYLDIATFDLHRVYCVACKREVDLIAQAIDNELTRAPWDGAPEPPEE